MKSGIRIQLQQASVAQIGTPITNRKKTAADWVRSFIYFRRTFLVTCWHNYIFESRRDSQGIKTQGVLCQVISFLPETFCSSFLSCHAQACQSIHWLAPIFAEILAALGGADGAWEFFGWENLWKTATYRALYFGWWFFFPLEGLKTSQYLGVLWCVLEQCILCWENQIYLVKIWKALWVRKKLIKQTVNQSIDNPNFKIRGAPCMALATFFIPFKEKVLARDAKLSFFPILLADPVLFS